MDFVLISIINSVVNIFVTLSGIILLRLFAKRKVENDSYKPAVITYILWLTISYLGLSFIYGFTFQLYIFLDYELRIGFGTLQAILAIVIELFIISLLVKVFYKSRFNDSIFMTLQVLAIQILMRIITSNVLAIIFNLTTGGFASFYLFQ